MNKLLSAFIATFALTLCNSAAMAADRAVLCVQQELNALGFDAGPADGIIGSRTVAAGEAYRAFMAARHRGWAQPALTPRQAPLWCQKVAEAHPEVAGFWKSYKAAEAAPSARLSGTWRLNVTCRDFSQVNTVRIGRADAAAVLGTTNVDDGYGKIIGGSVQGNHFTFTNTYRWEGRTYTEIWSGSISRNDSYLKGSFKTNNNSAGGCRFAGARR